MAIKRMQRIHHVSNRLLLCLSLTEDPNLIFFLHICDLCNGKRPAVHL